jgi:hypothetical protein
LPPTEQSRGNIQRDRQVVHCRQESRALGDGDRARELITVRSEDPDSCRPRFYGQESQSKSTSNMPASISTCSPVEMEAKTISLTRHADFLWHWNSASAPPSPGSRAQQRLRPQPTPTKCRFSPAWPPRGKLRSHWPRPLEFPSIQAGRRSLLLGQQLLSVILPLSPPMKVIAP